MDPTLAEVAQWIVLCILTCLLGGIWIEVHGANKKKSEPTDHTLRIFITEKHDVDVRHTVEGVHYVRSESARVEATEEPDGPTTAPDGAELGSSDG